MIWFYMVTLLLCPLVMVGFGALFYKKPPKTINSLYGYRTSRSMKNEQTWAFAHRYIGKLWLWLGAVLGLCTLALFFVFPTEEQAAGIFLLCWLGVELIVLIAPIFPTERALKRHFDKDGNPLESPPHA